MENKERLYHWRDASKVCSQFISDYSHTNYTYSKELSQIYPKIGRHLSTIYPNKYDLCVLITDMYGISLTDEVKKTILRKCNKLVRIVADNDADVLVEEIIMFR